MVLWVAAASASSRMQASGGAQLGEERVLITNILIAKRKGAPARSGRRCMFRHERGSSSPGAYRR